MGCVNRRIKSRLDYQFIFATRGLISFGSSRGGAPIGEIEDNIWLRGDMKFIFECSTRYLTSERSERVRYRFEHEKINFISPSNHVLFCLFYSGAPAGAEGARGRSSIPIEIGKPIKARKFGSRPRPYVRPYVRTHGLGLGTSLSLSLIWSPSYAKVTQKHFLVC